MIDDLSIEHIAQELASNRVERDKAWAEFTLVTVVALLGIPTLCFKLGFAGTILSLIISGLWIWIGISLRRTIKRQLELDGGLFECEDRRAVGLLFESLPYAGGAHKARIRAELKSKLPKVEARSAHVFTWEQRSMMRKALLYGGD